MWQLLRIQLFIIGQGRVKETRAALALRHPRLGCGPNQVRPCNLPCPVERLGSAFCVGQRSGYLELCLLVGVHSALRVWPAQPTGLNQEVQLLPVGHGYSYLLPWVLSLCLFIGGPRWWTNFSSILTKLFPTGCPKGFYGKHCRKKCHCANRGRCHRLYGACLCDPGLYGRFCHLGEFYYIYLYE